MAERWSAVPARRGDRWEPHRRERLAEILEKTTAAQRLAWLEEAIEFARRAGALPRSGAGPSDLGGR